MDCIFENVKAGLVVHSSSNVQAPVQQSRKKPPTPTNQVVLELASIFLVTK